MKLNYRNGFIVKKALPILTVLSITACNSGYSQAEVESTQPGQYFPNMVYGNYVANNDELRNILPMVSIIKTPVSNLKNVSISFCGGIIVRGYHDRPLLITASHCLVEKGEITQTIEASLPRHFDQPYFSNNCFANSDAEFYQSAGVLKLNLRNCISNQQKGFQPSNDAVMALVAAPGGSARGNYYLPPVIKGKHLDLAVVPLDVEKEASVKYLPVDFEYHDMPHGTMLAYGWADHYDNKKVVYGKLVAQEMVFNKTDGVFWYVSSKQYPNKLPTMEGDSGGPALVKNSNGSYTLEGIIIGAIINSSEEFEIDILNSTLAIHDWLAEISTMDLSKGLPAKTNVCTLGKECNVETADAKDFGY